MIAAKRIYKRNSHNVFFKAMAGFGRALNRLYENRNHDIYSNGELSLIKKLSKLKPSVIIDGGANIGKYSLIIHEFIPGATIYSFEPVKKTFEELKENVGSIEKINPIEKGLYSDNCTREINIFSSSTHSSLIDIQDLHKKSNKKQTVELVKGDDFMRNHQINEVDLLKLDLEGAEYDAIMGFNEHIEKGKIKMIQFEYGQVNILTRKLLADFYEYFESKGYRVGKIYPKTVEFRKYKPKHEDFLGPNFVVVKETETELIKLLARKKY